MSGGTSWVDLLGERPGILVRGDTPQQRSSGELQSLKRQVASLLEENNQLTEQVAKSREEKHSLHSQLCEVKHVLEEERRQSEEVCQVLEEQSKLISQLSQFQADNGELNDCRTTINTLEERLREKEHTLQGVYAHVQELRSEVNRLSSDMHSSVDLERLQLRNGELRDCLSSTNTARTLLERELVTVKQQLTDQEKLCRARDKEINTLSSRLQAITLQHEKEQKLLDRELRVLREEKSCLEQKVCDLEGALGNARCQLDGRSALLKEMKGLLEQRATRIKHLEKSRDQLSLSMETDLLNGSTDSLVSELSVCSSGLATRRRFTSAQAEIGHLKKRLAESRADRVRLELTCAQLRSDSARLLGSQQALESIKQQLLSENTSLDRGQRSFRDMWNREKETMARQLTTLQRELHKTRDAVCTNNTAELKQKLNGVQLVLECECVWVCEAASGVEEEVTRMHTKQCEVLEAISLTKAVNSRRATQIMEKETAMSQLMAQLDVLRARKKVVYQFISENDDLSSLHCLKKQLKKQKAQTNFVRLRLGYVLRELRLYKKLTKALEERKSELESGLRSLQTQHLLCVEKLATVTLASDQ